MGIDTEQINVVRDALTLLCGSSGGAAGAGATPSNASTCVASGSGDGLGTNRHLHRVVSRPGADRGAAAATARHPRARQVSHLTQKVRSDWYSTQTLFLY